MRANLHLRHKAIAVLLAQLLDPLNRDHARRLDRFGIDVAPVPFAVALDYHQMPVPFPLVLHLSLGPALANRALGGGRLLAKHRGPRLQGVNGG